MQSVFVAQLARRYVMKYLVLESDSQVVINCLTKGYIFFWDLISLLDGVCIICISFDFIYWSHIKRDENFMAHHLAGLVSCGSEQV